MNSTTYIQPTPIHQQSQQQQQQQHQQPQTITPNHNNKNKTPNHNSVKKQFNTNLLACCTQPGGACLCLGTCFFPCCTAADISYWLYATSWKRPKCAYFCGFISTLWAYLFAVTGPLCMIIFGYGGTISSGYWDESRGKYIERWPEYLIVLAATIPCFMMMSVFFSCFLSKYGKRTLNSESRNKIGFHFVSDQTFSDTSSMCLKGWCCACCFLCQIRREQIISNYDVLPRFEDDMSAQGNLQPHFQYFQYVQQPDVQQQHQHQQNQAMMHPGAPFDLQSTNSMNFQQQQSFNNTLQPQQNFNNTPPPQTQKCKNCDATLPSSARFCNDCGHQTNVITGIKNTTNVVIDAQIVHGPLPTNCVDDNKKSQDDVANNVSVVGTRGMETADNEEFVY